MEEIDGMPLDGESAKIKRDDDLNGVPPKGIVPYGDDIDGEPRLFPLLMFRSMILCLDIE